MLLLSPHPWVWVPVVVVMGRGDGGLALWVLVLWLCEAEHCTVPSLPGLVHELLSFRCGVCVQEGGRRAGSLQASCIGRWDGAGMQPDRPTWGLLSPQCPQHCRGSSCGVLVVPCCRLGEPQVRREPWYCSCPPKWGGHSVLLSPSEQMLVAMPCISLVAQGDAVAIASQRAMLHAGIGDTATGHGGQAWLGQCFWG